MNCICLYFLAIPTAPHSWHKFCLPQEEVCFNLAPRVKILILRPNSYKHNQYIFQAVAEQVSKSGKQGLRQNNTFVMTVHFIVSTLVPISVQSKTFTYHNIACEHNTYAIHNN